MKLFLYRTQGVDADEAPIDFGVIRAMTIEQALNLVLVHIEGFHERSEIESIRIYPLSDRNTAGVLEETGFKDFQV